MFTQFHASAPTIGRVCWELTGYGRVRINQGMGWQSSQLDRTALARMLWSYKKAGFLVTRTRCDMPEMRGA